MVKTDQGLIIEIYIKSRNLKEKKTTRGVPNVWAPHFLSSIEFSRHSFPWYIQYICTCKVNLGMHILGLLRCEHVFPQIFFTFNVLILLLHFRFLWVWSWTKRWKNIDIALQKDCSLPIPTYMGMHTYLPTYFDGTDQRLWPFLIRTICGTYVSDIYIL
jgi:hypothetical protein